MAISLLAHALAQGTSISATTAAQDTTGATLLVLVVTYNAAPTISDSKSNSWTKLTEKNNGTNTVAIWYATPTSQVGSGHTFTASSGSAIFPTIAMLAFSGVRPTSPFDVQNGATTGGATTLQPGSITPSIDNELIIAGLGWADNSLLGITTSIGSSYSITDQHVLTNGVAFGAAAAYLLEGTAAATNPTWTMTNSTAVAAVIASFKGNVTTPQTITGKARITATVLQTITGKARITARTLQTLAGKARITGTTLQTITGIGRITARALRTITGVGRITATTLRTITGTAHIVVPTVLRTITGKARITATVLQTITGTARIAAATNSPGIFRPATTSGDPSRFKGADTSGTPGRFKPGDETGTPGHFKPGA